MTKRGSSSASPVSELGHPLFDKGGEWTQTFSRLSASCISEAVFAVNQQTNPDVLDLKSSAGSQAVIFERTQARREIHVYTRRSIAVDDDEQGHEIAKFSRIGPMGITLQLHGRRSAPFLCYLWCSQTHNVLGSRPTHHAVLKMPGGENFASLASSRGTFTARFACLQGRAPPALLHAHRQPPRGDFVQDLCLADWLRYAKGSSAVLALALRLTGKILRLHLLPGPTWRNDAPCCGTSERNFRCEGRGCS